MNPDRRVTSKQQHCEKRGNWHAWHGVGWDQLMLTGRVLCCRQLHAFGDWLVGVFQTNKLMDFSTALTEASYRIITRYLVQVAGFFSKIRDLITLDSCAFSLLGLNTKTAHIRSAEVLMSQLVTAGLVVLSSLRLAPVTRQWTDEPRVCVCSGLMLTRCISNSWMSQFKRGELQNEQERLTARRSWVQLLGWGGPFCAEFAWSESLPY